MQLKEGSIAFTNGVSKRGDIPNDLRSRVIHSDVQVPYEVVLGIDCPMQS